MDECFCLGADIPIRQGDIFLWEKHVNPEGESCPQMGVILTADCDIANNKFGDFLTYVPVLSLHDYINNVLIINKLEKQYEKHIESVINQAHKHYILKNPDAKKLTRNSLEQWVSRKDSRQISDMLCISEGKQRINFENTCEITRSCLIALQSQDPLRIMHSLVNLHQHKGKLGLDKATDQIFAQIGSDVKSSAQDVFFISAMPDIKELGFIAMLRQIHPIAFKLLTTSVQDKNLNSSKALRIARLRDVYKYALTQKFAMLFNRIGLPTTYEDSRQLVVDDLCESFSRKLTEGK